MDKRDECPDTGGDGMKRTCDVCGKEAVGMQILGCCCSTVCEEHAEYQLREMKPGEKKEWGVCYFYRFPDDLQEQGSTSGR